jgi:hypothetical protein
MGSHFASNWKREKTKNLMKGFFLHPSQSISKANKAQIFIFMSKEMQ